MSLMMVLITIGHPFPHRKLFAPYDAVFLYCVNILELVSRNTKSNMETLCLTLRVYMLSWHIDAAA